MTIMLTILLVILVSLQKAKIKEFHGGKKHRGKSQKEKKKQVKQVMMENLFKTTPNLYGTTEQ